LSTVNHIIRHVQLDNAFTNPDLLNRIPRTIRDAMCVVDLSHERYLWVDFIYILQDDEVKKQERPKHLMRWSKSGVLRLAAVYLSNPDNTSQECIIVTTTAFFLWIRA